MRIVVAIDGSECSKEALLEAANMQCPKGSEFLVVTAFDSSEPLPVLEDIHNQEYGDATNLIETSVKSLKARQPDAEVTGEILDGNPVDAIIKLSRDWLADQIIVGSHGRRGLSKLWLGSVSRALLLHAPCAVRIVRSGSWSDQAVHDNNVLIGLEVSEHSRHLIDHVLQLTWPENTKFLCVHVIPPLAAGVLYDDNLETLKVLADNMEQLIAEKYGWLQAEVARLNEHCDRDAARAEVLAGDTREKILETAKEWPAQLIMLGSHGRSGIDKLILGSVSDAVTANAPCSVEVTRIAAIRKHSMHVIV